MKYFIDNQEYNVEIIRKNNKNTYIRVKENNTIVITTNYFTTKKMIEDLLNKNIDFLKKVICKKNNKKTNPNKYLFLGKEYHIITSSLIEDVQFVDNKLYIPSKEFLDKWCDKKTKNLFKERYDKIYNLFEEDIPFYRLRFRKMKTRWGVCNKKSNTITLNTKLIEYDISCIDYVIVHELSHLIEFNHSKNFWNVVEKYCPNYKIIRKILKD